VSERTADTYLAFAVGQAAGWSPTYERLAYAVAQDPVSLALLDALPEAKRQPNLLFGVSRLLDGPVDDPAEFTRWLHASWGRVRPELLARTTQTNEAARCAALLPALLRLPGPLALLEVGASAGLCLYPDRYRYDYGSGVVGDGDGPVLRCAWQRPEPPPDRRPDVAWRAGLDLNPLDLTVAEDRKWLECLVWPEHSERRQRLREAARMALADPAPVHRGDLLADLPGLVARVPAGLTLVVVHTAVLAYIDPSTRRGFVHLVRELGAHWLATEHPSLLAGLADRLPELPQRPGPQPFLSLLDGRSVGWCGPHGQFCA